MTTTEIPWNPEIHDDPRMFLRLTKDSATYPVGTHAGADRYRPQVDTVMRYGGGRESCHDNVIRWTFVERVGTSDAGRPVFWVADDEIGYTGEHAPLTPNRPRYRLDGPTPDIGRRMVPGCDEEDCDECEMICSDCGCSDCECDEDDY